jgi:hypothetical protein
MSIIGLGRVEVSSEIRVPNPPARMTAFKISSFEKITWSTVAQCVRLDVIFNRLKKEPILLLKKHTHAPQRSLASGQQYDLPKYSENSQKIKIMGFKVNQRKYKQMCSL